MDDDQVAKPAEEVKEGEEGGEKKDEGQMPAEEGAGVDAGGVTSAPPADAPADEGDEGEEEEEEGEEEGAAAAETPAVE